MFRRLHWLLIRTPYRDLVKATKRLGHARAVQKRRAIYGQIDLDEAQLDALSSLREFGYADAGKVVDRALLQTAYDCAQRKIREEGRKEEVRLNPDKDFWERLLDEDADDHGRQPSDSPFVRLAISERVLDVAAAYLDDAPLLDYVHLLHSSHKPGPLKVSQLWHRDYDDSKVLKLFVYLTDCETEGDGPFTFLPADISRKVGFSLHSHRTDEALGLPDLDAHAKAMKAPKLSAFFVDTSRCYHMGSRVAPGHERVLYMSTYATFPKFNGRTANTFAVSPSLSARQRVALTYA